MIEATRKLVNTAACLLLSVTLLGSCMARSVKERDGLRTDTVDVTLSPTNLVQPRIPQSRADFAMVYDVSRQVSIMYGGQQLQINPVDSSIEKHDLADTWEYDGQNWQQVEVLHSPPARHGHGMAFDPRRGMVVLYGGTTVVEQNFLDNVWEYDGVNWYSRTGFVERPGTKAYPIMVFDPLEQAVVLMVGSQTDDMWLYDGEFWLLTSVIVPTPTRFALTARSVFDSKRQVLLLYEGRDIGWGNTYELIDGVWEPVASQGDGRWRLQFDLAFDRTRGVTILFGGAFCERPEDADEAQCYPQSDTWEFDGEKWYQVELPLSPPARYGHAMTFDEARGVVVLFGGIGIDGNTLNDTWEYDGAIWTQK